MKKITKILSLLLAVAMVLSLNLTTITALAADYTITINNTTSGYTYAAYQIFSGTLSGSTLSDIEWGSGIDADKTSDLLTAIQGIADSSTDPATYPFKDCTSAKAVAEVLAGYADDSAVAQAFADVVSGYLSTSCTTSTGTDPYYITINEDDAGYYFVKNTVVPENGSYTRYILEVVKDVTTTLKQDIPTVEKKVLEESYENNDTSTISGYQYGTGYNDVADYDIGDAVPFKLIGTLPSNLADYDTYKYIFHDTLGTGLTFNSNSVEVYVVNGTDETLVNSSCYDVVSNAPTDPDDGCTFEVRFSDIKTVYETTAGDITISSTSKIVVKYTATLNTSAAIGLPGNENEVYLEYSNNPNWDGTGTEDTGKTPKDYNIVFTYELDVTKIDGSAQVADTPLAGVEFKLYKTDDGGTTKYYVIVDSSGKVTGWTDANEAITTGSTLTSDVNGKFSVIGLDEGTYYLEETKALDGYNTIDDITIVIAATTNNGQSWTDEDPSSALTALTIDVDGTGAVSGTSLTGGALPAEVENNKGAVLPNTGGMGTKIFYTLGGLLVVCAGVLLIVKRRMRNA